MHNFACVGVSNLFLNSQQGLQLSVLACHEHNKEFYVSAVSAQSHNILYRINAVSGALVEQPKHTPQGFEIVDFISIGQANMVVVIKAKNGDMIFYAPLQTFGM